MSFFLILIVVQMAYYMVKNKTMWICHTLFQIKMCIITKVIPLWYNNKIVPLGLCSYLGRPIFKITSIFTFQGRSRDSNICLQLVCYDPTRQSCQSAKEQRAAEGTTCGNKKVWVFIFITKKWTLWVRLEMCHMCITCVIHICNICVVFGKWHM